MANFTPLINKESYSYCDIDINILGQKIYGVTSIEYTENQAMENIYGTGKYPVSRGYGNVEPTCKMTWLMEEVEALTAIAPNRRLQDIPEFDIIVSFLPKTGTKVTHKIRNCRFMNNGRTGETGATKFEVELELIISHVEW